MERWSSHICFVFQFTYTSVYSIRYACLYMCFVLVSTLKFASTRYLVSVFNVWVVVTRYSFLHDLDRRVAQVLSYMNGLRMKNIETIFNRIVKFRLFWLSFPSQYYLIQLFYTFPFLFFEVHQHISKKKTRSNTYKGIEPIQKWKQQDLTENNIYYIWNIFLFLVKKSL